MTKIKTLHNFKIWLRLSSKKRFFVEDDDYTHVEMSDDFNNSGSTLILHFKYIRDPNLNALKTIENTW